LYLAGMETTARAAIDAGARLIDAIAAQDFDAVQECFAPDARLRGLVPSTLREEEGAGAIAKRLRVWFGEVRDLELIESELEPVSDRVRIRYRLTGDYPDEGPTVVEQCGYLHAPDGRITILNLVCSGNRPVE